uniref:Endo/exonuclease/phosphatase domain-containing protein n=1 Tax=Haemonchus contortus TaxID=6289 RepID=A0A7I4YUY0_HAECO
MHLDRRNFNVLRSWKIEFNVGRCWFSRVSKLPQARVKSVTFHGHRLAIITAYLSRDSQVTIIQAYAPTADSDEEQHDNFYEQLEELLRRQRGYVVVMGDFNARIGLRKHGEVFIGPHSAEARNEPGERLASSVNCIIFAMAIVSCSRHHGKDGLISRRMDNTVTKSTTFCAIGES